MNFCLQRLTISRSLLHRKFTASCVSSEFVKTKIENEIGVITLSDPKRLNALTVAMGENFRSAVAELTQAAKEQRIRAVVVTGEGDAFSAGGDLNWLMERHHTSQFKNSDIMVNFYNRFLCIREVGVPTIAAINGAAIGAGMCMTLACDMRVAATNAKLGFTFAKLGIHPGMGSSLLLPRIVSQETASYMLLSGAIISGEDAKQRGLVLETVPKDKVLLRALEIAKQVADNSPIAVQSCTRTLHSHKFAGLEAALLREADTQAVAYSSQDFVKGIEAVKSKTSPKFMGWE